MDVRVGKRLQACSGQVYLVVNTVGFSRLKMSVCSLLQVMAGVRLSM